MFGRRGPDSAADNAPGEVDLLWDAEVCPEGTAIIYRSTQGPNQLRIETVQPPARTCFQGLFSLIAFAITFLYLFLTIGLLFLIAPTFYGGLAPGIGFLLIIWIEVPLIIGAYVPLAVDIFTRYIEPLITKEILELDAGQYTYSRELHPPWLQIFRRRSYVPVASGGEASEFAGAELLTAPHGIRTSLFLTAGFEFGFNIGQRDAEMLLSTLQTYLRSVNIEVQSPPPSNRPPHNPCYTLALTEHGVNVTFATRDTILLLVGYLSLWTLPLSLIVPLLPFVGYNRTHPNDERTDYFGGEDFDANDTTPGIVWAGFHSLLYLWWSLEYLTTLTVSVDKATGFRACRRFAVLPCIRLPFLIMDGVIPTFKMSRPSSDILSVDEVGEAGSALVLRLLPRMCRSRQFVLPHLSHHELKYLHWLIKDSIAAGPGAGVMGGNVPSGPGNATHALYTLSDSGGHGAGDVEFGYAGGPAPSADTPQAPAGPSAPGNSFKAGLGTGTTVWGQPRGGSYSARPTGSHTTSSRHDAGAAPAVAQESPHGLQPYSTAGARDADTGHEGRPLQGRPVAAPADEAADELTGGRGAEGGSELPGGDRGGRNEHVRLIPASRKGSTNDGGR